MKQRARLTVRPVRQGARALCTVQGRRLPNFQALADATSHYSRRLGDLAALWQGKSVFVAAMLGAACFRVQLRNHTGLVAFARLSASTRT